MKNDSRIERVTAFDTMPEIQRNSIRNIKDIKKKFKIARLLIFVIFLYMVYMISPMWKSTLAIIGIYLLNHINHKEAYTSVLYEPEISMDYALGEDMEFLEDEGKLLEDIFIKSVKQYALEVLSMLLFILTAYGTLIYVTYFYFLGVEIVPAVCMYGIMLISLYFHNNILQYSIVEEVLWECTFDEI